MTKTWEMLRSKDRVYVLTCLGICYADAEVELNGASEEGDCVMWHERCESLLLAIRRLGGLGHQPIDDGQIVIEAKKELHDTHSLSQAAMDTLAQKTSSLWCAMKEIQKVIDEDAKSAAYQLFDIRTIVARVIG